MISISILLQYKDRDYEFKNLESDTIIENEGCEFKGIYTEGKVLSYRYNVYDKYKNLILSTPDIKDDSLEYRFSNLENKKTYYIELICFLESGKSISTDKIKFHFYVDYNSKKPYKALILENNLSDGIVEAKARLIEITGEGKNYEFTNDNGIKVNEDGFISFTDFYNLINKNFTLKIWLDASVEDNLVITKIYNDCSPDERIEIKYRNKRFYAFKYSCGVVSSYISMGNEIDFDNFLKGQEEVFLLLKSQSDMIDLYAEVYKKEVGVV